jgi:hypothetical protein
MTRIVLSFALVAMSTGFVMLGCGTDTTGGSTTGSMNSGYTPPATIPIENASTEFSKAYCAKVFACCDMAELADAFSNFKPPQPTTEAECVTAIAPEANEEFFSYLASRVMAGAIAYDASKAGGCFAAVAADCAEFDDDFLGELPACKGVFTGKVADGGDCFAGIECVQAGSTCLGTLQGGTGKCGPRPKENEPCPDFECASGLVCLSDAMGQSCKQPLADGQMCGYSGDCASGYCDFTALVCAPKKANGEACKDYDACKDGFCDFSTTMKCTAEKAEGEACVSLEECASKNCNEANKCAAPQCDGK